jgi:hypothetical protein
VIGYVFVGFASRRSRPLGMSPLIDHTRIFVDIALGLCSSTSAGAWTSRG